MPWAAPGAPLATPGTCTELNLSSLAPGLSALRATAGAATATQRLVVKQGFRSRQLASKSVRA